MGKNELMAALAMMHETDRRWKEIEKAVQGNLGEKGRDERLVSLADVASAVNVDRTWLHRLGIRHACGHQIAGRLRYSPSEVRRWLESPECHAACKQLSRERREQRMRPKFKVA